MAFIEELHNGDIGTIIRATIRDLQADGSKIILDISSASLMELIFRKPDGTKITQTAVFTTDGTNGQIEYVILIGDIDQDGDWKVQGRVVLPSGDWKSDIKTFKVHENL